MAACFDEAYSFAAYLRSSGEQSFRASEPRFGKVDATDPMTILPTMGVVVGIPCSRPVMPEWAIALATQQWPINTNICYVPIRGKKVDAAREYIVKGARELKSPYVLMVDDDVEVPIGAFRQLLQTMKQADDDVMVVAGIYPSRSNPPEPIVYQQNGHGAFWKWKRNSIFEVKSCIGTGCMFIKMEVFDHISEPWFKTVDEEDRQITDDAWFCDKVIDAGFKILADAHVICAHWDMATQRRFELPDDSYPMIPSGKEEIFKDLPDGWMNSAELDWLTNNAQSRNRIVEVGAFLGRSTVALARSTKGEVWAIDDFRGPRENDEGRPVKLVLKPEQILETFQKNIASLANVRYIQTDHADYANLPAEWLRGKPEEKPDMIFIDGDHEYESVKRDILVWKERLAPGGLLCGHDSNWPGVRSALNELLPGWRQEAGAIWSQP